VNRLLKTALVAGLPVLWAAGCSDFLKCSECTTDPNRPSSATMRQRFEAIQANNWIFIEGDLARLISMWMQGMAGTDRQYKQLGTYVISEADEDGEFSRPYQGGGLIDIRMLEDSATAAGDQVFLGVAQIMEAWMIGNTADMWGDIPYSQAAKPDSFPTPVLDRQQDVYTALQALLDQAITNLAGAGTGPGNADLVYGGSKTAWTQLAYTLKARLYLHTAERVGTPAYQNALDAANKGISSNANDYVSKHTTAPGEDNPWYQFIVIQRSGYISAGKFLVDLLNSTSDPRAQDYFTAGSAAPGGAIIGAAPGAAYTGSFANLSEDRRLLQTFRQPDVTYNENLLIKAEALFNLGQETAALDTLNKERAAWANETAWHGAITLPATPSLSGTPLLQAIMTEKYITLFQNIEVWNDYKRTCMPALTPAAGAAQIPARLFYGVTERQTNPNIPDVGSQPTRNWNDLDNGC
jgi:hypothetical protein